MTTHFNDTEQRLEWKCGSCDYVYHQYMKASQQNFNLQIPFQMLEEQVSYKKNTLTIKLDQYVCPKCGVIQIMSNTLNAI